MSDTTSLVLPHHQVLLDAAGITPEVIAARGYRSLQRKAEVRAVGFTDRQALVPCLLIPLYGPDGTLATYQIQPDEPRSHFGVLQPVEVPSATPVCLDVPPTVADLLAGDGPLVVAASVLAADAAASRAWPVISVHGESLLPGHPRPRSLTWPTAGLLLEHRMVLLDTGLPDAYRDALAAHLDGGGAEVRLLPYSLLTCLATVPDLPALVAQSVRWEAPVPAPAETPSSESIYQVHDGCIVWCRSQESGQRDLSLTNFTATIIEEIVADDGQEEHGELVIAGRLASGELLPTIRVAIERFDTMQWPTLAWGAQVIVRAGHGARDRVREAIQWLSPPWPRRREYTRPGWLQRDGQVLFLTQDAVIGPGGVVADLVVRLDGAANLIRLGAPPTGTALHTAVREALRLLDLAPDRITVPLFAGIIRAVLTPVAQPDVVLFLVGPSGVLKSELAAAFQRAFGTGFDRLHLPASWAATANALERIAFDFKDCLLVIDDFAPAGSVQEVRRYHQTADRMIRGAGNASGRDRMQADGTLRRALPPRGLILGTGEDVPRGHSIRARMLVLEVDQTAVNRSLMGWFQGDGRSVPARMLAGFIPWLSGRMDQVRAEFGVATMRLRTELATAGIHARTPEALAGLGAGWNLWLTFAVDSGAITQAERDRLWERVRSALHEVATSQAAHLQDEDPVRAFLNLVRATLTSGTAHVVTPGHGAPASQQGAWGWFRQSSGGAFPVATWVARGDRIGWVEGDDLYLDPTAAYRTVQHYAASSSTSLAITEPTLWKRMREAGLLRSVEAGQQTNKVRKTIGDSRRRVIHVAASLIVPPLIDAAPAAAGQDGRVGRVVDRGGPDSEDADACGLEGRGRPWDADGGGKVTHDA